MSPHLSPEFDKSLFQRLAQFTNLQMVEVRSCETFFRNHTRQTLHQPLFLSALQDGCQQEKQKHGSSYFSYKFKRPDSLPLIRNIYTSETAGRLASSQEDLKTSKLSIDIKPRFPKLVVGLSLRFNPRPSGQMSNPSKSMVSDVLSFS